MPRYFAAARAGSFLRVYELMNARTRRLDAVMMLKTMTMPRMTRMTMTTDGDGDDNDRDVVATTEIMTIAMILR